VKIREIRPVTKEAAGNSCGCNQTSTNANLDKPPCCGPATCTGGGEIDENVPGFQQWLETPAGRVPQIASELRLADRIGGCKARWGIGRMHYIVPAGLYAVGAPDGDSQVVVTANFKMSYDLVRRSLAGKDVWLLVLETFGVNVWCAAGKGTFGTDELVRRIDASGLGRVVTHRRLILPILGAPGVAAHEVKRRSGFAISYATIRAADLPAYLDNSLQTTPAMRELTFSLYERLVLIPVEVVMALKPTAIIGGVLFLAAALLSGVSTASWLLIAYMGAVFSGVAIAPLLLPWLPGPSFAGKGAMVGLVWSAVYQFLPGAPSWHGVAVASLFFALPAVSAFYTLNFTGCTTYTSRTGVKKEMRLAMPVMGGAIVVSALLCVAGFFF